MMIETENQLKMVGNNFSELTDETLMDVNGGVIPMVVWGIWTAAAGTGLTDRIAAGLDRVN